MVPYGRCCKRRATEWFAFHAEHEPQVWIYLSKNIELMMAVKRVVHQSAVKDTDFQSLMEIF